jgi:hypothetical protein
VDGRSQYGRARRGADPWEERPAAGGRGSVWRVPLLATQQAVGGQRDGQNFGFGEFKDDCDCSGNGAVRRCGYRLP